MRRKKYLSLMASLFLALGSFNSIVFAEDEDSGSAEGSNAPGANVAAQVYNVDQDADPAKGDTDLSVTYTIKEGAQVAAVAWHQWHSPNGTGYDPDGSKGTSAANNADLMVLNPGTNQTLKLQHFFSSSNTDVPHGNLVVLVKPIPGYLVIGLDAPDTLKKYYSVIDENGNPRSTGVNYTGMGAIESRARKDGYPLLLNWFRNSNSDIRFTVSTAKVGVNVTTVSDKSVVNIGETVTLKSTIKAIKIDAAKAAAFSLDETSFNEKINGNDATFSNPVITQIAPDTWERVVSYKVKAADVKDGKFVYSISPKLTYEYTLTVSNGDVTSRASTTDKFDTEISLTSNEIQIQGNTSSLPYDGIKHSESGAVINGEFILGSDGTADIVVGGINYHISGVKITAATGTEVNKYSSNFDTNDAKVTTKENGETIIVNNFNFSTNPGSLEITPASLSLAQVPDVTYNGQDQTLNKAQEQVIANAVSYLKPVQSTDATNAVSVNAVAATNPPTPELGKDYTLQYEVVNGNVIDAGSVLRVTAVAIEGGNYTGSSKPVDYKILPRPLRVGTNSNSKIYDGKPLTAAGSIDGALASDNLRLITTGSQTDVGSSQNTYRIDYGNAKAGNYYVAGESIGTLTVYAPAPRPNGRTCQQDGYAAGYAWDDAQQACVLRERETSPSIKNVPGTGALRK